MAALRELAIILGVEVDEEALDDAESSLAEFKENAAKYALAAVAALGTAAIAIVETGRHMAVAIDSGARQLGISRQEFQQWSAVAEAAGAEGDKIIDVMANLQEKARGVALDPNGAMAETFERLGVAARDANGQIRGGPALIRDVANALARMGPGTERTATAMELFGDAGRELLPVLGQGSAAIDQVIADFDRLGGGLDDEAIESSLEFNRSLLTLKNTIGGALSPILRALNPIATSIAETFTEMAASVRALAERTTVLRTAMIALALGGITGVTIALYTAMPAIIAWIIAWSPFIATVLLVAGTVAILALAMDDLITFLEGGDSALGDLLDTLGGAGTAREVLDRIKIGADNFANAITAARIAVNMLTEKFDRGLVAGEAFADGIAEKLEPLQPLFNQIGDAIDRIMGPLEKAYALVEGIRNLPASIGLGILDQATSRPGQGPLDGGGQTFTGMDAMPNAQQIAMRAQGIPVPGATASTPMGKQGVTNTISGSQTTDININGIIDPRILVPHVERIMRENADRQARELADEVQGG